MELFGEPSARERLVWRVRDQIRRLAVEGFGATQVQVPIGRTCVTRPALDDPLAGLRAADLVCRTARAQVRDFAADARAAGRSWTEVAEAIGLTRGTVDEPEVHAFEQVAGDRDSFGGGRLWWRCAGCEQQIVDSGPFTSHPADIERGHAVGCARHTADIDAWAVRTGWDA